MGKMVSIKVQINNNILNSLNLSQNEFFKYLQYLVTIFNKDFLSMFPTEINDYSTASNIIYLSKHLQMLEKCEGFSTHIKNFKGDLRHSSFMTNIAHFLLPHVDLLKLEPHANENEKHPDIFIKFRDIEIFLECKVLNTKDNDFFKEHKLMVDRLQKYLHVPHQIDIRYNKSLSVDEIEDLGKGIEALLKEVTSDGKIIDNDNLEVQVQIRDQYGNPDISTLIVMVIQDISTNCYYPGHAFSFNGKTMSIGGPKLDYSKFLLRKIDKCRNQAIKEKPYILIIDGNKMLGDYSENIRRLSTSFQPTRNTRISGILIAKYGLDLNGFIEEYKYISNPYSKFPVPKEFSRLFLNPTTMR
jgi:hypothetical protein